VDPFRFSGVGERPAPRRFAALVLLPVGVAAPVIPALSLAAGATSYWSAFVLTWAVGAVPGLIFATLVAAKPRLPRVIAGMAIVEVLLIGAAYIVVLAIGNTQ